MMKEAIVIDDIDEKDRSIQQGNSVVIDEDAPEDVLQPGEKRTNEDGTVTIALVHPKEFQMKKDNALRAVSLTELTIRRPTGADIRKISAVQDQMEGGVRAFQILTGHPPAVFDILDGQDINTITEVVQGMLGKSRMVGKNI